MPNKNALKLTALIGILLLIFTGCESSESDAEQLKSIKPNPVTAPPELIEKIKATNWHEHWHTCGVMSMSSMDYKECILVEAALLPSLDPAKRDHFGWHYDPPKYYDCRIASKRGDVGCYKYQLRRDEPEPVWPYPDVPPIQWPEAPLESVYKRGMSDKEYFDALCEAEAGKFIYKTVEDVEGVYQIRPRKRAWDFRLRDQYVMEDPYHYAQGEATRPGISFLRRGGYSFFETVIYEPRAQSLLKSSYDRSFLELAPEGANYIRYEGEAEETFKTVKKVFDKKLKSQYGYIWRGIKRPYDREHAIAGGELAVVDLSTNEILGLWRGFLRSVNKKRGKVWWLGAQPCPTKQGQYTKETYDFVFQVLKPKQQNINSEGNSK